MDILFEIFNADGTKNGEVTRYTLLEIEVNEYMEKINAVVIDLNRTDMFLEYDWFVKHKSEVNWKTGIIQFTRCPRTCRTHYQDISFTSKTRRIQPTDN